MAVEASAAEFIGDAIVQPCRPLKSTPARRLGSRLTEALNSRPKPDCQPYDDVGGSI